MLSPVAYERVLAARATDATHTVRPCEAQPLRSPLPASVTPDRIRVPAAARLHQLPAILYGSTVSPDCSVGSR